MRRWLDVQTSLVGSSLRGWRGTLITRPVQTQPAQPLQLHDREADPACKLLREALTEMDLDALILPCPEGGRRFAPKAGATGELPSLRDPNTGQALTGHAAIERYLAQTYGAEPRAAGELAQRLAELGGALASGVRGGRGGRVRRSKAPKQPLELFSFESSPFSRIVREVLCELELPYLLRNTGKGRWSDLGPPMLRDRLFRARPDTARNRTLLFERTGRVQVPYLIDPNAGVELFESEAIVAHLEAHYAR